MDAVDGNSAATKKLSDLFTLRPLSDWKTGPTKIFALVCPSLARGPNSCDFDFEVFEQSLFF